MCAAEMLFKIEVEKQRHQMLSIDFEPDKSVFVFVQCIEKRDFVSRLHQIEITSNVIANPKLNRL